MVSPISLTNVANLSIANLSYILDFSVLDVHSSIKRAGIVYGVVGGRREKQAVSVMLFGLT